MKCLDKERARRYETASGLAADVKRYLDNEPVTACPPEALAQDLDLQEPMWCKPT